ncbi:ATP-dependent helicase/nuclease subunit B [Rhizobium sp. RU20A]|uniref:double-strand break repair protein AddB n=1 Tax=Rhizobium sp. RU20A TaxID=1907412 RepID=UPI0009569165|nr:double-strand break repair protein AddB [Rhizobium sp. RU20A]SIQ83449.1 ATP-dependent helicase/nuclease subunit B [Rhizobium sp. RU20A]
MSSQAGNIFTIPPGLPFLKTFAARLLDGAIVPDFVYDPDQPLDLAEATIFLPTRRAVRVLRSEFVDLLGGRSAILPTIRALGETDDDAGYFDADLPDTFDLAPPVGGATRLIELARLILAWRNGLPSRILDIHDESPLIAPVSPADALWLAKDLVALIDAMETERCDWAALDTLDAADHATWWQLTLEFLKIARLYWPERLKELNRSSSAAHRNAILAAEARRIAQGRLTGPIIVAGSTGSIPATADMIAAVRQCPRGAIVLPGLDQEMEDADWLLLTAGSSATASSTPRQIGERSHPQYGLARLIERLGVSRAEIEVLSRPPAHLDMRGRILSRAMLPVEATERWTALRADLEPESVATAFADVSLVELANEREEALVIAMALRLALEEGEDRRAALITPDRDLARRVTAELKRFGIDADDSGGRPLVLSEPGSLIRLVTDLALRRRDRAGLAALLKHPLCRLGRDAEAFARAADTLERLALRNRRGPLSFAALAGCVEQAIADHKRDTHPPAWRQGMTDEDMAAAHALAGDLSAALMPLLSDADQRSIADWSVATSEVLEALAADPTAGLTPLWGTEAGEELANLLRETFETDGTLEADAAQWADALDALLAGLMVKPRSMRDPHIFIFGAMESRLQDADLFVLGGLNEGAWPGQTRNDPFLSRVMKTAIGLEPPERRIGQLAHDLVMAAGAPRLMLTRALRSGSAPTVASRWLQRLLALGGERLEAQMRRQGAEWQAFATALDQRPRQPPAERPQPRPAADLQPQSFSFSEVSTLRRDPYAIYARRILRLHPVDPFANEPDARERGVLYHAVFDRAVRETIDAGQPDARLKLSAIIEEAVSEAALPTHLEDLWRERLRAVGDAFLDWQVRRAPGITRSLTEVRARFDLGAADVAITGVADRIDLLADGRVDLIDYKTGASPSKKEAQSLLDPQLPLEAAGVEAGGFRGLGSPRVRSLYYVRLKPGERFEVERIDNDPGLSRAGETLPTTEDLARDAVGELRRFVLALRSGKVGFASRLVVQMQGDRSGPYDHLARVAEWSTAEPGEGGGDE